jgi:hypothetical protein
VPPSSREWAIRLRALALVLRGDLQGAIPVIDSARQLLPSGNGTYVAAEARFLLGQQWEFPGGCGDHDRPDSLKCVYRQASTIVAPLVYSRYDGADWQLLQSNHVLGKDRDTRSSLQTILRRHPDDSSALQYMAYVCYEHLSLRELWPQVDSQNAE